MDHQAIAQLLGNYGEFVGAIAVVATLAYLALQVRYGKRATEENTHALEENRRLIKVQAIDGIGRRWEEVTKNATGTKELASIFVRGNRDLSELDEVEQVMYTRQLALFLNYHMAVHQMAEQGFLGRDDEIIAAVDQIIAGMLKKHSGAAKVWEVLKWSQIQREHLDSLINKIDVSDQMVLGESIIAYTERAV